MRVVVFFATGVCTHVRRDRWQRMVMKKRLATHREDFEAASPYHVVKAMDASDDGDAPDTDVNATSSDTDEPPPFLIVHGMVRGHRASGVEFGHA